MRSITISICIFTNLIILGMFGYFYLLLSQYWTYWSKHSDYVDNTKKDFYDKEIYYYNRGYPNETNDISFSLFSNNNRETTPVKNLLEHKNRNSRQVKPSDSAIFIEKNQKPRFGRIQNLFLKLDTKKYTCLQPDEKNCRKKTGMFKHKVIMELERYLREKPPGNDYNVSYDGAREMVKRKSNKELLCKFKRDVKSEILTRGKVMEYFQNISKYFPVKTLFQNKHFNTCALVSSAGSLINSNLGKFIDSHDLVLRCNHAPTKGYESDVGSKTTIRILNSQVVSKPKFNFVHSQLFKNITVLVWDPPGYKVPISEWLLKPEHPFFNNYFQYKKQPEKPNKLYLMNPDSVWSVWDFLQSNFLQDLPSNPPSSGFLALSQLLKVCSYVDLIEYIPSVRVTPMCHYYDTQKDPTCTFGSWHPLAAEKLLTLALSISSDYETFQKGYVRIPGFKKSSCDS